MTTTTTTNDKPAPTPLPMGKCDRCGVAFQPIKPWQLFCSTKCRTAAHQVTRYADNVKARKLLATAIKDLASVESFLAELTGKGAADALGKVQRIVKRATAIVGAA